MAQFQGTMEEFKRFFDGFCKNKVNAFTRKEKREYGKICHVCGKTAVLEAAHKRGHERVKIIEDILNEHFAQGNNRYDVNMDAFLKIFRDAQTPIEDYFYFLCRDCHRRYDKGEINDLNILNQELEFLQSQIEELQSKKKI